MQNNKDIHFQLRHDYFIARAFFLYLERYTNSIQKMKTYKGLIALEFYQDLYLRLISQETVKLIF